MPKYLATVGSVEALEIYAAARAVRLLPYALANAWCVCSGYPLKAGQLEYDCRYSKMQQVGVAMKTGCPPPRYGSRWTTGSAETAPQTAGGQPMIFNKKSEEAYGPLIAPKRAAAGEGG